MRKTPVALTSLAVLLGAIGETTASGATGGLTQTITIELWLFLACLLLPTDTLQNAIRSRLGGRRRDTDG